MSVRSSRIPKKRFILPFTTIDTNKFKHFTKNMEMAVVLCLAEYHRKKGESQFLKKKDEKIVFVAQVCYPVWLVPWNNATLVFDGLAVTSHVLSYDLTPDVETFNMDIVRNQKSTEAYTAVLSRNIDYFNNFPGAEETKIEGLIATPDLREALRNYLPLMKEMNKSSIAKIILKPTMRKDEIRDSVRRVMTLRNKIEHDIKNIETGVKVLNSATTQRVNAIKQEIKKTRKRHYKRIERTKQTSTKKIQQIQGQYNRRIARASTRFKKRFLQLNRNQAALRNALRNLKKEIKRCETKLKNSRSHNRKQSEHQWTLKLKRLKKNLSTLRRQIKANTERIRDAENAQKLELAKQRIKFCARIASASKKFRDLQGSEQAEIIMKRQEIATLEHFSRYISRSIQEMAQKKKLFHVQFDRIALPRREQACKLVYIPFYLVRYEKAERRRYDLYPPSIAGDIGLLTKMKGTLVAAKVKALFRPRSEALATFLNRLPALFEDKPILEQSVTEDGIRNSILLRKNLRTDVNKGLEELRNEKWISKNVLEKIGRILYMYSSSIDQRTTTSLVQEDSYQECIQV